MAESIAKLKNRKRQDYDGNTAEILKYADRKIHEIIAEEFNRAIPKGENIGLNTAILLPIQKPKKPQVTENPRSICIVPVMKKILSHSTLNRIRAAVEKHIGHTQSAYKKSRSSADVIWTHRFNMATSYTGKKSMSLALICRQLLTPFREVSSSTAAKHFLNKMM